MIRSDIDAGPTWLHSRNELHNLLKGYYFDEKELAGYRNGLVASWYTQALMDLLIFKLILEKPSRVQKMEHAGI